MVLDRTNGNGVICKLQLFQRLSHRDVVLSADGSLVGEDGPLAHLQLPVSQQTGNPLADGGRHCELGELLVEDVWIDGVEGPAEVHK